MQRFEDKIVVVTGAAGGIGSAASVRFASEGAMIVAVDLTASGLAETVASVESFGGSIQAVTADVTKSADVEGYVQQAIGSFGGIDIFFNNAGIEGIVSSLEEYPEDIFEKVLDVNVKGVWLGIRHVADVMRARGGGSIINSASGAGLIGTPELVAYGASKHAVIGITKTAAIELASDNIRVNAVCPGGIDTRMVESIAAGKFPSNVEAFKKGYEERNPMSRYGTPEEVASLVAFLASDEASYINGSWYSIDGGASAL